MYSPLSKLLISIILIFIVSCVPVNNSSKEVKVINYPNNIENNTEILSKKTQDLEKKVITKIIKFADKPILNEVEIILPVIKNKKLTKNLINSFELSIYKKKIDNLNLNINKYLDLDQLDNLLQVKSKQGKIFIGTLGADATKVVKEYCNKGILFFSFAADKNLAEDCVYLINFFPEDDLVALFNYFPTSSKVALLYPENFYGYSINDIINPIASQSKSFLINKVSYKEDLSNARESIIELGKYELRKYELDRQKKILKDKDDEISKKALKKIQKFETLGDVNFTHLILSDYGIRLLEIAPLLPFYDVDPNKVKFVGTGVWDNKIFFDEPSLQGAIFSGIEEEKRKSFFNEYFAVHKEKPIRTATIPHDLVAILSYIINENMSLQDAYELLDNNKIKFDGIDGKFYFIDNIIFRELGILEIKNGEAIKLN